MLSLLKIRMVSQLSLQKLMERNVARCWKILPDVGTHVHVGVVAGVI